MEAINVLRLEWKNVLQAQEKKDDLSFQLALGAVARAARRVEMTTQQEREYALYRRASEATGVEPTRADFLLGEIPSCVTQEMGYRLKQQRTSLKAKAAGAGR